MEFMPIGISIVDEALQVRFWNRALLEILDFPESLLRRPGLTLVDLFRFNAERGEYGEGDVEHQVAERAALARRFEPHRLLRQRPDGRFVDIRGEVVRKPDGSVGGFISLYQDVTREQRFKQELLASNHELGLRNAQLQQANEELRETQLQLLQSAKQASIGRLAAGLAHEINNPLGFVMSNQSTLQQNTHALIALTDAYAACEGALPERELAPIVGLKQAIDLDFIKSDAPQLFNEMHLGLERVRQIVASLQTFADDRSGIWEETDPAHELDRALAVVQTTLPADVTVVRDYAPLPPIRTMRGDIAQVLLALLQNAADAVGGTGTITLRCGEDGDRIFIEIGDTGCGINNEDLQHLFDPFFTTKPVGSGIGLSLAVSQRIVRNHDGQILVSSEVGRGSRFRIELPKEKPAGWAGADEMADATA